MTPKDKKQQARGIAAYKRSIRPDYIAKKMVRKYARVIDPGWKKGGDPKVLNKAKRCAIKSTEDILSVIQSNMDVRHTSRSQQDRELVRLYENVKTAINQI